MAFPFDSAVVLSPEAESLQRRFEELHEKMAAEAKCVPEDHANLAVEKEEWCRRWNKITIRVEFASKADQILMYIQLIGSMYVMLPGILHILSASPRCSPSTISFVPHGHALEEFMEDQQPSSLRALKSEAARQAEIKSQQIVPADVSMEEEDDDEDGKDEVSVKRPLRARKSKAPAPTMVMA
ncbi:hypothetical protein EV702DRAFT_1050993 [Suillus placidus]|uniref:Uncharacterized protein n=1 Tax=Suillus placidus TaxID=48579 RepID=A0A9P7CX34_9AGAM|nr:hypothetical protein EV702DRAFT_1050993 [Suillus placidus]